MNIKPEQIPDEVVEAALNAFNTFPCPNPGSITSCFNDEQMKAALAAALPVLLGEPVAFISKTELKGIPKHGGSSLTVLRTKQNGRLIALYTLPTQDATNEK